MHARTRAGVMLSMLALLEGGRQRRIASLRHDDDLPCGEVNQSDRPWDVGCRESSVPAALKLPVHKDIGGLSSCIPVRSAHSTDRRVDAVLQIECWFSMSSQSPFSCVVVSLRINGSTNDFKVLR
jgi:hypothetical protein